MFFYDNLLELDEVNQLPLNQVTAIRLDSMDTSAWVGCRDGEVYRIDLKSMQASDVRTNDGQTVVDLDPTDSYLFCLSKDTVRLFNLQQQAEGASDLFPNSMSKSRDHQVKESHLINLDSRSALSTLCPLGNDQYLLGGCQSELYRFDVSRLSVIKKYDLLESPSSCLKIKQVPSKFLIVTASLGGQITLLDKSSFQPILTYKPFNTFADFDLINDTFIVSTGFDSGYSNQPTKSINIFDLRNNSEMVLYDDTKFYSGYYVRGLRGSGYCLTLDKNGVGEVNHIEDRTSFQSKGKHFSIEVQPNATICSCEVSLDGSKVLSGDKNGFFHVTSLKATDNQATQHIQINDIVHRSADGATGDDDDDTISKSTGLIEINRNLKIRPHYFLSRNVNHLAHPDSPLKEITSKLYN